MNPKVFALWDIGVAMPAKTADNTSVQIDG